MKNVFVFVFQYWLIFMMFAACFKLKWMPLVWCLNVSEKRVYILKDKEADAKRSLFELIWALFLTIFFKFYNTVFAETKTKEFIPFLNKNMIARDEYSIVYLPTGKKVNILCRLLSYIIETIFLKILNVNKNFRSFLFSFFCSQGFVQ